MALLWTYLDIIWLEFNKPIFKANIKCQTGSKGILIVKAMCNNRKKIEITKKGQTKEYYSQTKKMLREKPTLVSSTCDWSTTGDVDPVGVTWPFTALLIAASAKGLGVFPPSLFF